MSVGFVTLASKLIMDEQNRTKQNRKNRESNKTVKPFSSPGQRTLIGDLSKPQDLQTSTPGGAFGKTRPFDTTQPSGELDFRGDALKGSGKKRAEAAVRRQEERDARIARNKREQAEEKRNQRIEDRVEGGQTREEAESAEGAELGSSTPEGISIERSPALIEALRNLGLSFDQQNQDIRGLSGDFEAGFGDLTRSTNEVFDAQQEEFDATRRKTLGTLKDDIARRRISGSSFAADSLGRVTSEFDKRDRALAGERNTALATSKLQEADVQQRLFTQANDAAVKKWQAFVNQFNFETEIAQQLTLGMSGIASQNARHNAELRQAREDRDLQFITDVGGAAIEGFNDNSTDTSSTSSTG